jgi:hypothetical protein
MNYSLLIIGDSKVDGDGGEVDGDGGDGQEVAHFLTQALSATNTGLESSGLLHCSGVQFGSGFRKEQDPQSIINLISMKRSTKGYRRLTTQDIERGLQTLM